jgi:type I restriction-modification system DNA methylase subunit
MGYPHHRRKPVSIPGKLFYSAQISVCLWFLTKNEHARKRHLSLCLRSTKTEFATTFSNNKNEEKKYIAPAKVEGATKNKGYFKRSSLSETQI